MNQKPDPLIGQKIAEKYLILEVIGEGGMGRVYKALHEAMEKFHAVKILRPDHATTPESIRRFQNEAKAASRIEHPNCVSVTDFGSWGEIVYLVMDYVEGPNLAELIREGQTKHPFAIRRAIPIFRQICDGLAAAHQLGIIHRDVKSSNVILTEKNGERDIVKITDFGIAKIHLDGQATLTEEGAVFGSPLYMSPEQCMGKRLDARSDIYSLGCLMYEVLSGDLPLKGENAIVTMAKQQTEIPEQIFFENDVNKTLAARLNELIVSETLAKDPEERPQTMEDLKTQLLLIDKALDDPKEAQKLTLKRKKQTITGAQSLKFALASLSILGFLALVSIVTLNMKSGIALSIPHSEREIAVVVPYQKMDEKTRTEMDDNDSVPVGYAKTFYGEKSPEYFRACMKAGDDFNICHESNYAMKYYGPAALALKHLGFENTKEAAELSLKIAECSVPLDFGLDIQIQKLKEAEHIFWPDTKTAEIKPVSLAINLIETEYLIAKAALSLSKKTTSRSLAAQYRQMAASSLHALVVHYFTNADLASTKYPQTLLPALNFTGDYFFDLLKQKADPKRESEFRDFTLKSYEGALSQISNSSEPEYLIARSSIQNKLGDFYLYEGKMLDARLSYELAYANIANIPTAHAIDKAKILFNLSDVEFSTNQFADAASHWLQAFQLWRSS